MNLLNVSNLSIQTGDREVVSKLSFTLRAGDRLGLIGESGAGKSLTALAILGLLPPPFAAAGSILLDGEELIGATERALEGLRGGAATVVSQDPFTALDPVMRVGRQIAESITRRAKREGTRMSRKEVNAEVEHTLEQVSLSETRRVARSFPLALSGGELQRVAIAMAIACRPKLLVADEPTAALDVTIQAEVLDLLDRLVRDRGMALLFIGHDLPVVASVVDSAIVLQGGREVERGPVRQLLASPVSAYTRRLVEDARRMQSMNGDLE